jgi:glycyl-tRNA synthetase beta chain
MPLLVEVGCEEIPARFLSDAQRDFGERLGTALAEGRLWPSLASGEPGVILEPRLQTYSTPRRLVAYVPEMFGQQSNKVEEVRGPAVKVAYDPQGNPTRAAESFAAKNGAEVQDLVKVSTAKGEYVAVRKTLAGRSALEVLPEILPHVITGVSFPKSMYWEPSKTRFIRPIRWILALLGEGETAQVMPFEIAGVRSGSQTYGHRTLGPGPLDVCGFADYAAKLRGLGVELDPEVRRQWLKLALQFLPTSATWSAMQDVSRAWYAPILGNDLDHRLEELRSRVKALPQVPSLKVVEDKELEDWVVSSTECPRALMGSFEERFLKLPREILVTVMRDHQKYFALEDRAGNLQPQFIASLNLDSDPKGYIRAGHERVLTARFSDAEFFWNADQKISLRDRLPILERVTYQAKLGSYGDKVSRMEAIANKICGTLSEKGNLGPTDAGHVLRAVQLCKCDLTTQMVQEFTELQGIVGGLYAKVQGEPQAVWQAIYDHYLPLSAEGQLPRSLVGGAVSLADKLDSVITGFAAGLEPTGSSDPFGLRRAGNGIIKLSIGWLPGLNLLELLGQVQHALALQEDGWFPGLIKQGDAQESLGPPPGADVFDRVSGFLRERVESYLETVAGLRYDTVRAVVRSYLAWTPPADALARGSALEKIRDSDDFVALSLAAKRTRNILMKSAKDELRETLGVEEKLLTPGPEEELYRAYNRVRPALDNLAADGEYEEAFRVLAGLRPQVDCFFDKVLVMDEDLRLRHNRLNLLTKLDRLVFARFADLSQIESTASNPVDVPTSPTVSSGK